MGRKKVHSWYKGVGGYVFPPPDFLASASYPKKTASNKAFILLTAASEVPEVRPKSNYKPCAPAKSDLLSSPCPAGMYCLWSVQRAVVVCNVSKRRINTGPRAAEQV